MPDALSGPNRITVSSTSYQSARVLQDYELSRTATTRRVLRAEIVINPHNPRAGVEGTILHQRKGPRDEWQDVAAVPLSKLKAREVGKLILDSSQTLRLFERLKQLYMLSSEAGVRIGKHEYVVGRAEEIIQADPDIAPAMRKVLAKKYPSEVWDALAESEPDLVTKLSYAQVQSERKKALEEFDLSMGKNKPEEYWDDFFARNDWVFGYGLDYRFLGIECRHPHVGGADITGRGGMVSDYLVSTRGISKFTVLVEIKTDTVHLLAGTKYRNRVWAVSAELVGGVSQLQTECRRMETEAARSEQGQEWLDERGIYTIHPRGILVVGHLGQLDSTDKRTAFEVFRRNLHNPTVVTYDELFERAKFIVEHTGRPGIPAPTPDAPCAPAPAEDRLDDIPF